MDNLDYDSYLDQVILPHILTDNEANKCEGLITTAETKTAVSEMKLNKSPGPDGLTLEFYCKFWSKVELLLINSYNESYHIGELYISPKKSLTSLLYKKDNTKKLDNWRPISLLHIYYKILAHALANRLHNVLPSIISQDQQCFIKNRCIGSNIRLFQDIIDYTELLNCDGAI